MSIDEKLAGFCKNVDDIELKPSVCKTGGRVGLVVRALAFRQCGPSGFDPRTRRHTWNEFVGSLLCYERFSPGYSGFPLSPKTNI